MTRSPSRVLVLRALGLGDLCTSVPPLRGLRRAFPRADLVLAAPAWQEPLARLAGVDRVAAVGPLEPLPPEVHGADLAVNLHGRGPQSTQLLASTAPGALVAFAHNEVEVPVVSRVEWRAGEHEVHRWCRLLTQSGIDADPSDIHLPVAAVDPPPLPRRERLVAVVHPGAAAAGRRWPAPRFAAVADALAGRGFDVVLTGSPEERLCCGRVATEATSDPTNLAGQTNLMQLAGLVATADLVVANDTGVAHLATAFGTPSVVLFGPTSPAEWGPPQRGPHCALWAGHRGDPHASQLDPGLAAIGVDQVLGAIEQVTRSERVRARELSELL